jgi:3-polyprenyl-4-hydroxybenzoate decarboxylase
MAGGLRGAAVELVHCTMPALDVPAYAAFVVEADFAGEGQGRLTR